ncbi:MAG: glycosyltransferase family 39 protein, partial [Acidobacteriota bacterium]
MEGSNKDQGPGRGDLTVLGAIALGVVVLHTLTNGQYGLHRDELQVLDDARHLDWGFVAYPPFAPVVERVSMALFGTSVAGLRLFSAMAQGLVIFLGGRMARELDGKRFAQVSAALAVAVAPLVIFEGTEFQYSSFDLLWWALIAYFVIRLFKSDNPRWWVAVGTVIGLGLVTKYSAAFFVAGIVGGVLLTRARRYLINPWLWCGVGAALIVFLPNLIWQSRHHFVAVDFLRHIHSRDVSIGRTAGFVKDQFLVCTNPLSVPIWLAGLCFYLFEKKGSRYRMLGWVYLITFAIFFVTKGRGYYLGPAYPMLFAAGAVMEEQWVLSLETGWSRILRMATFAALAVGGAAAASIIVPILSVDSPKNIAIKVNEDLREEIGWKELVG